jgi:hypothetical protein
LGRMKAFKVDHKEIDGADPVKWVAAWVAH